MKSLLVIAFLVLGAITSCLSKPRDPLEFAQCCERPDLKGRCVNFTEPASNLDYIDFSDKIASVMAVGTWVYYENAEFNNDMTGRVYFSYGVTKFNFPLGHRNLIHSLQPIKTHIMGLQNCLFFFEGTHLSDEYHASCSHQNSFRKKEASKFRSLLLIGSEPWTIYSGPLFYGLKKCVRPNVDHPKRNLGVYVNMTMLGFSKATIRAVKIGCHAPKDVPHSTIKLMGQDSHGGWGKLR